MNIVTTAEPLTPKDFASDQEVRWCPGCGDYAVLKSMQKALAEIGATRENTVFISGIGCAARFPYYMSTFGFHTIHGRAPAIATGAKLANPDLDVWVMTGDGDALSIGGNHLLHVLRRNVNLQIILFNNETYGLTKGQYSPTSKRGTRSPSTPGGSLDHPVSACAFVSRVKDAEDLAKEFNSRTGLGNRGLHPLVGQTSRRRRKELIDAIGRGDVLGYITCGVGAEAVDIPRLSTCHMIVRTKSFIRMLQATGRTLRLWENKPVSRIIDYNILREDILMGYAGLLPWAELADSRLEEHELCNGGPLVARKDKPVFTATGYTISQEQLWVRRQLKLSNGHETNLASYLDMVKRASSGRLAKNWYGGDGNSPFDSVSLGSLNPEEALVVKEVADEIRAL